MGTYNRRIKFGLKIPNHLGKMPVKIGGGGGDFLTHTVHAVKNTVIISSRAATL